MSEDCALLRIPLLPGSGKMQALLSALLALRDRALDLEQMHREDIEQVDGAYRASACNLVHYMSVRQHDIRAVQQDLISCGLSSLSNIEANTLASIEAVLQKVAALNGSTLAPAPVPPVDFRTGPFLLEDHTDQLLGTRQQHRATRIMVTMPSEAADNGRLILSLLKAGMDVMRINCAHDDAAAWTAMAKHLHEAERITGRQCRIQVDLAGPKLRTGELQTLGEVVRLKPLRDVYGQVTRAFRVQLEAQRAGLVGNRDLLGIDTHSFSQFRQGDTLTLRDARGKRRYLRIVFLEDGSCIGEGLQTVYIRGGAPFQLLRAASTVTRGHFGAIEPVISTIVLRPGDLMQLTRSTTPGGNARHDENGRLIEAARVHCTLEVAFDVVQAGERVWFDDGRIGGRVESNDGHLITVRIDHASVLGSKLRSEKGINFPDTRFQLAALTDKDVDDLEAVVKYADIIAVSFLRSPDDIVLLETQLQRLGASHLGVVLKIENREAFENLPRILLASLRLPPVGVMVARGDLAVEVGFERLSELQEEIIWLCEAAHVPVIWATQMLEGLAKRGIPSRAEITDAAASCRAECAMLNKGPNIVETVRFLSGILGRMETHQHKRRATLRRLSVSEGF